MKVSMALHVWKCSGFGKFGVLCFLVTPVLRCNVKRNLAEDQNPPVRLLQQKKGVSLTASAFLKRNLAEDQYLTSVSVVCENIPHFFNTLAFEKWLKTSMNLAIIIL